MSEKKKAKLKEWNIRPRDIERYYLTGIISEDELDRGFVGELVNTSTLLNIDFVNKIAETRNTIYELV